MSIGQCWILLAIVVCVTKAICVSAADSRPNFVLLMGDDHGWGETGYHGHPHVKTPVLDEMAARGIQLDRFYAAHPNCSPTRASFLTGRHPNRMGTFSAGWSIRPEEITLGHLLRQAGYRCGHFGKWHVGAVKKESPVSPGAMGFHEWLSHDNFFEMNPSLSRNGEPPEVCRGESSEILVNEAIRFIQRAQNENQPFLCVVWFGSPHEPYSGLPEDLQLYDDLPSRYKKQVTVTSNETGRPVSRPQGEVLRERYAEITAMDRAIGLLRASLAKQGLHDNTFLFYCGDNGTSRESAVASRHLGAKGDMYEGGLLVPGLIEFPAQFRTPRVCKAPASTSDLLPTLCHLSNVSLPRRTLDGIDLVAMLDDPSLPRTTPLYFWEFDTSRYSSRALEPYIDPEQQKGTTPLVKRMGNQMTRDFKNVHHPEVVDADYQGAKAIILGNLKLVVHDAGRKVPERELFDLSVDPKEEHNILERESNVAADLETRLNDWQQSVLHSLMGADYR